VANIEEAAIEYDDPKEVAALLRDPDDDYLVALAREAGVDAIVTGDRDLLDHSGLKPTALDARSACKLLGLLE
jgi:predicted nucleic acid-binding protein